MIKRHPKNCGFALLMTLVLVMMAGVALASVARRSMLSALDAQTAEDDLRRRWAVTSCERTLLARVEEILFSAEHGSMVYGDLDGSETHDEARASTRSLSDRNNSEPVAEIRVHCKLADIDYEFVFTDEQAKLNVNSIVAQSGRADAHSRVTKLVGPGARDGRLDLVRLRTYTVANAREVLEDDGDRDPGPGRDGGSDARPGRDGWLPLRGYDQVFNGASAGELIGELNQPGLARSITCWGDGRVNIHSASSRVLEEALRDAIPATDVRSLLRARDRDPSQDIMALLREVKDLSEAEQAAILRRATDRSTCHGLWMIARTDRREWHTLAIGVSHLLRRGETAGHHNLRQTYRFSW